MNEINKFLILATEDIQTAQFLHDSQRFRPSISRAYYAMYYAAQALLLSEGLDTSTHKGVIKLINFHFTQTGKLPLNIAKLLKNAHDLRQLGDYSTDFVSDEIISEKIIEDAKTFVNEVEIMLMDKN